MQVETGLLHDDLSVVPDEARRLERLGFDRVTCGEVKHDPFFPLLLAAEHTQRIGIGTSVAIAFPRSPMIVANMCWDLQAFSRGRMVLGLGSQVKGHNERRFSVTWSPAAPRMREYVRALRAIWDCWQKGTPLDAQGKHYHFTLMTPEFNPGPIEHPHIPVFISSVGAAMARVAGEVCDGVRIHGFTTRRYTEEVLLPAYQEGARRAGRSLDDFHISGGGFIAVGRTQAEVEQAREESRRRVAFYASTRTYKAVMDLHGWGETCLRLHEMVALDKWDQLHTLITDEMVDTFTVSGTYDDIIPKIRARYEGLVDSIGFSGAARTPAEEDRVREVVAGLKALRGRREPAIAR